MVVATDTGTVAIAGVARTGPSSRRPVMPAVRATSRYSRANLRYEIEACTLGAIRSYIAG